MCWICIKEVAHCLSNKCMSLGPGNLMMPVKFGTEKIQQVCIEYKSSERFFGFATSSGYFKNL